jgi:hypothetical protein
VDVAVVGGSFALLISYGIELLKDTWKGIYYYVDAICQGAERLGDREAIPVLEQLQTGMRG